LSLLAGSRACRKLGGLGLLMPPMDGRSEAVAGLVGCRLWEREIAAIQSAIRLSSIQRAALARPEHPQALSDQDET
jgi:hypothetical protein